MDSSACLLVAHAKTLDWMKNYITDNLMESKGSEVLTSLHSQYMQHLQGEESTYSAESLRVKIFKAFPDQLSQCKMNNKQSNTIYNRTLSEETAIRRELFNHSSVVEVACYLREMIRKAKQKSSLPKS